MPIDEEEMTPLHYIRQKLHNLTHPVLGKILMLHRVVEERSTDENRELEVTPDFLQATIENYLQQGFRFVSIDQVRDILQGKDKGKPFVCLTFDDGYRDTYDVAYPILKTYNIPFTVYVTTSFINGEVGMWWYNNQKLGLNIEQLRELDNNPLCTIGAHTVSHPRLDTLTTDIQNHEIIESKRVLEEILGHKICHFSYPHGDYNAETLDIVKRCGFASSLRAWGGTIRKGDFSMLELPRIELIQDK